MDKDGLDPNLKIFISYTTRDSYINTKLLKAIEYMVSDFCSPFIDLLHNDSNDKQAYVELKLAESDMLLLLSSASVSESNWVQWELNEAHNNGIPIVNIPINCDNEPELLNTLQSRLYMELDKLTADKTRE